MWISRPRKLLENLRNGAKKQGNFWSRITQTEGGISVEFPSESVGRTLGENLGGDTFSNPRKLIQSNLSNRKCSSLILVAFMRNKLIITPRPGYLFTFSPSSLFFLPFCFTHIPNSFIRFYSQHQGTSYFYFFLLFKF